MNDQKIENLLNLAMDATTEEREKSESLSAGYNRQERTWEVIVRYSGDLPKTVLQEWKPVVLSGGYATLELPGGDVDRLAALPQIEYVEMPKRLYFEADIGRSVSCLSLLQTPRYDLFGQGVLVAVIDSGVDYFHPDFRNDDGTTRILALWDQTAVLPEQKRYAGEGDDGPAEGGAAMAGRVPPGFLRGVEYTKEEIDRALETGSREAGYAIVPERDDTGHGTQVLGIAAGNGRASGGRYRGVASRSDLIVVKLGLPGSEGFPRTTELMQGLEYVIRKAAEYEMPVAVNVSFGNVYGSHRGTSLLESYINQASDQGRSVISVGTGNEGNTGGHASGRITDRQPREIEFLISDFETSLNLQVWKNYADEYRISLVHPDGRRAGPFGAETGASRYLLGNTELLVYYGIPGPYQGLQEIFIDFLPAGNQPYLDSGVWRAVLTPEEIVTGRYELWMNDSRARGTGTRFLNPDPNTTMTIPSTAARVIAVGAYDGRRGAYAPFSGRGWPEETYGIRPDLVAPGVGVTTTALGGGYISATGTSFAAPFVTGASALLMQWGIVDGNDPYLYGEKVRAYLQRGARRLPGFETWPNNLAGYGALCVGESLP